MRDVNKRKRCIKLKNKLYVVRIVTQNVGEFDKAIENSPVLECLRYAEVLIIHRETDCGNPGTCFDLLPPRHISVADSKRWANWNAERMSSMGINAVCAPQWE